MKGNTVQQRTFERWLPTGGREPWGEDTLRNGWKGNTRGEEKKRVAGGGEEKTIQLGQGLREWNKNKSNRNFPNTKRTCDGEKGNVALT